MYKVAFIMNSLKKIEVKYDGSISELEQRLIKAYSDGYYFFPQTVRNGESRNRYFIPMDKVEAIRIEEIGATEK